MHGELFLFNWPTKFSLVEVIELGGGLDAPGIGTASKEGGARTGGGMAVCAGSAGREKFAPTDCLPLGGVDILDKAMTIANSCQFKSGAGFKIGLCFTMEKTEVFVCVFIAPDIHSRIFKKVKT